MAPSAGVAQPWALAWRAQHLEPTHDISDLHTPPPDPGHLWPRPHRPRTFVIRKLAVSRASRSRRARPDCLFRKTNSRAFLAFMQFLRQSACENVRPQNHLLKVCSRGQPARTTSSRHDAAGQCRSKCRRVGTAARTDATSGPTGRLR